MTEPRRIPRTLSCLVKGPLGCLAFVVGAIVVLVLFFPPAGGRLVRGWTEEWFAEHHEGTLELGDAWVGSLYGPQRVEGLVLRDPHGEEVLRGSLHAPSFEAASDLPDGTYGPIVLHVASLRLSRDSSGRTNLARALERRPVRDEPVAVRRSNFTTDRPLVFPLEVRVERLRWSADEDDGSVDGVLLNGTLTVGPYRRSVVLAGGVPASDAEPALTLQLDASQAGPDAEWECTLELERAPRGLASVACPPLAPLARLAGPVVDRVRIVSGASGFDVRVEDEGASLDARGALEDGSLAGEGAMLVLRVPCSSRHADALLGLLPFLTALECDASDAMHVLRLEAARWPLAEGAGASGELFFAFAAARGWLVAPLASLVAHTGDARPFVGGDPRQVRVDHGQLAFEGFRLPLERGYLVVDGMLAPMSGTSDLTFTGELDGAPLAPLRLASEGGPLVPTPPNDFPVLPAVPPDTPVPADPEDDDR